MATSIADTNKQQHYATRRAVRVAKLHASADNAPLGALPADVVRLLGERLFSLEQEDKLNCLPTWARDVASIAGTMMALCSRRSITLNTELLSDPAAAAA